MSPAAHGTRHEVGCVLRSSADASEHRSALEQARVQRSPRGFYIAKCRFCIPCVLTTHATSRPVGPVCCLHA
eukprot:614983-Prymnesium_polylepis.1